MEDEEEEITPSTSQTSSTITLTQHSLATVKTFSSTALSSENSASFETIPQCQIVTHQASGDSVESEDSTSHRLSSSPRYSPLISKSPHSSSSQEEYEVDKHKGQYLTTTGFRQETTRSMESLRTSRAYHSTSQCDMRRFISESVETKSLESLEREMKLRRHAVSGEGAMLASSEEMISAEKRRGLWSGRMKVPQHLSLPPPSGYLSLSPGDRRLTILSPHSPHRGQDLFHMSQITLKTRRKKAMILPKLVLPRSESEISEVFSENIE
ncbi:uncharacterized protein LOC116176831 [Photinus pyralis]|uniref:uncharacterized protein LOC116176831 n=1 Tax=Photinus pyralis TaxID=7054 RepID=UPI0012674AF1|nr:uncharacterized protein LOC116176831 [Photinus pyralis]